jgi:hypothetical protein
LPVALPSKIRLPCVLEIDGTSFDRPLPSSDLIASAANVQHSPLPTGCRLASASSANRAMASP